MDAIDRIKEKLKSYPDVSYEATTDNITIVPKNTSGFEVSLWKDDNEIIVSFEGWHEHYHLSDEEDALDCFALGLCEHCRLKVHSRGGKDYRWILETKDLENNNWRFSSTTMVFRLIKFWKKKQIRYLQNSIMKIGSEHPAV